MPAKKKSKQQTSPSSSKSAWARGPPSGTSSHRKSPSTRSSSFIPLFAHARAVGSCDSPAIPTTYDSSISFGSIDKINQTRDSDGLKASEESTGPNTLDENDGWGLTEPVKPGVGGDGWQWGYESDVYPGGWGTDDEAEVTAVPARAALPNGINASRISLAAENELAKIPITRPSGLVISRSTRETFVVVYPEGVRAPEFDIKGNSVERKHRYDRDFLLQFMALCKDRPNTVLPLEALSLEPGQPVSQELSRRIRASALGVRHGQYAPYADVACDTTVGSQSRLPTPSIRSLNDSAPKKMSLAECTRSQYAKEVGRISTTSPLMDRPLTTLWTSISTGTSAPPNPVEGPACRMSREEARARIEQAVAALFHLHDIDDALSVFSKLSSGYHGRLVDKVVSTATESTDADAQTAAYFFYCSAAKGLCSFGAFEDGFSLTAAALNDIVLDDPSALPRFAAMVKGAGLHKGENR